MLDRSLTTRIRTTGALAAVLLIGATRLRADGDEPSEIPCHLAYVLAEGVFVDVGSEVGLATGATGWIAYQGQPLVRFEIGAVTRESTFLRLLAPRTPGFPSTGQRISLQLDENVKPPTAMAPVDPLPEKPFRPLLVTPEDVDVGEPENVFHGRLTFRQRVQGVSNGDLDYRRTELITSGSIERIQGSPWALEWAGDLTYRDGDALRRVDDYQEIRIEAERFALARRFDDESILRLGRFIPGELPSIGYLDGAHVEKVFSEGFRWGVLGGWKPSRIDLHPTSDEPTLATYATVLSESEDGDHFSLTGGALLSYFEGDLDRLAILIDQTAHIGRLDIFTSAEVDLDVGAANKRDGVRLTRLDVGISSQLEGWAPRVGASRYELLDTAAERDLFDIVILPTDDFLEDSYWRFYVGARHELSDELSLDEEVSYTQSETTDDGVRWRVSLIKRLLFGAPGAQGSFTVFNLLGEEQRGYGGRIGAYFPAGDGEVDFQPSMSFRYVDYQEGDDTFGFGDLTLRSHWRPSRRWEFFVAGSYSLADEVQRLFLELGFTLRW